MCRSGFDPFAIVPMRKPAASSVAQNGSALDADGMRFDHSIGDSAILARTQDGLQSWGDSI
jgi:hypothetical protein